MKYYLVFVWAALLYYLNLRTDAAQYEDDRILIQENKARISWLTAFLIFVPVIWMAINRGNFEDTSAYIPMFRGMPASLSSVSGYMDTVTKDKGFYLASCLIKVFFTHNATVYLAIIALFHGIVVVTFFRKYSPRYLISIFLFIASTDYISWMFNGIRQFIAVCIILCATDFALRRKYIPVVILIVLASFMHQSALIMLPVIFIAQGKAWNKWTLLFISVILLAITYIGAFTNILDDALSYTQYENVVTDYTEWEDNGTDMLRVLVYSIPAIISLLARRQIHEEGSALINFCANMSIISAGLYLISGFTSGIFIGRLPIYVSLYGYILLPWEIDHYFSPSSKRILYIGMFLAYAVFYYYQMHIAWGYM